MWLSFALDGPIANASTMTQPLETIQLPVFATAPHVVDPSGVIAAWFTDPPGVLMQFARPSRGTTEMAEWLVGPGFDLLMARFPGARELRIVLDMRSMTGRSATARSLLLQRAKTVHDHVAHVVILPSQLLGPAYVKIVEGTALMLRLAGLRVDVEHEIERVVTRYRLRPASVSGVELSSDLTRDARPWPDGPPDPRRHAR
jgi:hypothetical protein